MERRNFLKRVIGGAGTLGFWGTSGGAASLLTNPPENSFGRDDTAHARLSDRIYADGDHGAFSILQGATSSDRTQLSVLLPGDLLPSYRLIDVTSSERLLPTGQRRETRAHSAWAADQVAFAGLAPGRDYEFEVVGDDGIVLDRRVLRALDPRGASRGFAVVSCVEDSTPQATRDGMWDSLASTDPALVLMIGDNVYGARGNSTIGPEALWDRYVEVRQLKVKFYHQRKLIPTVGIWDDHDYGDNNGDHRYRWKNEALAIFNALYAQDPIPGVFERGPGVSSWFRALGVRFQLMDGRFFKGTPGRSGQKSQWGASQESFLADSLKDAKEPVFLVNGTLFFNTMFLTENYEKEFSSNFRTMIEGLRDFGKPLFFVSGDVHWSEITRVPEKYLGYETCEIVSSGMHTFRTAIGEAVMPLPNSRRLRGAYRNLFTLVKPTVAPGLTVLEITAYRDRQQVQYREHLIVRR
jgi:alkaline phosphatase D